jgi:hypothetical protein
MANNRFTDNQIAQLFLGLKRDFNQLQQQGKSLHDINSILDMRVYGTLYNLDLTEQERNKAYQVLATLMASMPAFRDFKPADKTSTPFTIRNTYIYRDIHPYHHDHYYCNQSDPFWTWLLLANLNSHNHYHHNHYPSNYPNSHHHGGNTHNDEKSGDLLAILCVIALVASIAIMAALATYYIIKELLDIGDRIWHNEGMLRAITSLATMAAFACLGSFVGGVLLAGPLVALATAAAINPIGLIVFSAIGLGVIGAGIGAFLFNKLKVQEYFVKKINKSSLDPAEPQRFSLSRSEERRLEAQNLDVIKVKCALVALREQMGEKVHSKFTRLFRSEGGDHQKIIEQVRQLKRGELTYIMVDELQIDLRRPAPNYNYYEQTGPISMPVPSAPPMETEFQLPSDKKGFNTGLEPERYSTPPPAYTFYKETPTQSPPAINPDYDPSSPTENGIGELLYPDYTNYQ